MDCTSYRLTMLYVMSLDTYSHKTSHLPVDIPIMVACECDPYDMTWASCDWMFAAITRGNMILVPKAVFHTLQWLHECVS
jgi:hypothetical protein